MIKIIKLIIPIIFSIAIFIAFVLFFIWITKDWTYLGASIQIAWAMLTMVCTVITYIALKNVIK